MERNILAELAERLALLGQTKLASRRLILFYFFYSFLTLHMKYYSIIIVTDPYTHNKQTQDQSTQIQHHVLHFPNRFLFTTGPFGLVKQLVWVGT